MSKGSSGMNRWQKGKLFREVSYMEYMQSRQAKQDQQRRAGRGEMAADQGTSSENTGIVARG